MVKSWVCSPNISSSPPFSYVVGLHLPVPFEDEGGFLICIGQWNVSRSNVCTSKWTLSTSSWFTTLPAVRWDLYHLGFLSNKEQSTPHSWPVLGTAVWGKNKFVELNYWAYGTVLLLHYNLVLSCLDTPFLYLFLLLVLLVSCMSSVLVPSSRSHIFSSIMSILEFSQEFRLSNSFCGPCVPTPVISSQR